VDSKELKFVSITPLGTISVCFLKENANWNSVSDGECIEQSQEELSSMEITAQLD
jgi:hypothetical protein